MKILLLTETLAGTGHYKAAESLGKAISAINPKAEVKIDTTLTHANPLLEKLASKLYMGTIRHASPLWGWAYKRDRQWGLMGKDILRKYLSKKLEAYIDSEAPDLIVSTHAFCLGGLAELKKKRPKPFSLAAAFTDYSVNSFWIHPEVDLYFVGAMKLKEKLMNEYSIQEDKVHVTGIPIDPKFDERIDKDRLRSKLGISQTSLNVLVMGGGLGLAPYEDILTGLSMVKATDLVVTVITGKNHQAKQRLEDWAQQKKLSYTLILLDYVHNINEWMAAADILIGKPGGLTVSEALACEVPLLIYKPIPGQEERNSQFLLDSGIAFRADNIKQLAEVVEKLCGDMEWRHHLRDRVLAYSKPKAAYDAGRILMNLLE